MFLPSKTSCKLFIRAGLGAGLVHLLINQALQEQTQTAASEIVLESARS